MAELVWDKLGEHLYETGTSKGVLYKPTPGGLYTMGWAWNGLTAVTETPTGAEPTKLYADNIPYLNIRSAEEFNATVEAYTYPKQFTQFDGSVEVSPGVVAGQQSRGSFGFSYQTVLGNDTMTNDYGYKIHLIYNATAGVSERAYSTVNDSPEAVAFSWELTTTPVDAGPGLKPLSLITIDSTTTPSAALATLEAILYGSPGADPRLPAPVEVFSILGTGVTEVTPAVPTFNAGTDTLTIPSTTGVVYMIGDVAQTAGDQVITEYTVVYALPASGYVLEPGFVSVWGYDPS